MKARTASGSDPGPPPQGHRAGETIPIERNIAKALWSGQRVFVYLRDPVEIHVATMLDWNMLGLMYSYRSVVEKTNHELVPHTQTIIVPLHRVDHIGLSIFPEEIACE